MRERSFRSLDISIWITEHMVRNANSMLKEVIRLQDTFHRASSGPINIFNEYTGLQWQLAKICGSVMRARNGFYEIITGVNVNQTCKKYIEKIIWTKESKSEMSEKAFSELDTAIKASRELLTHVDAIREEAEKLHTKLYGLIPEPEYIIDKCEELEYDTDKLQSYLEEAYHEFSKIMPDY